MSDKENVGRRKTFQLNKKEKKLAFLNSLLKLEQKFFVAILPTKSLRVYACVHMQTQEINYPQSERVVLVNTE